MTSQAVAIRRLSVRLSVAAMLVLMTACASAASQTRPARDPARASVGSPPENVRVMPLGDSITAGVTVNGGYRSDLWQLMSTAWRRVDFVGSMSAGPKQLAERSHEGHPGWEIAQIDRHVDAWLTSYRPDIVLLHIGTNDVLRNDDLPQAPYRLGALLDHITRTLPRTQVYVATIIPLGRPALDARARRYNEAISDIVEMRAAQGNHVHLVPMHEALRRKDLSADGIHPTSGGYSKMAAGWFAALRSSNMVRWEAEKVSGTTVNDGERLTDKSASGNGKVGYLNFLDSYVDFFVDTPTTGWHHVYVRAANGMKSVCTQGLTVNGRPQGRISYPDDGWDHWTINAARVWLNAGRNRLRFTRQTCAAELDYLDVSPDAG